MKCEWCHSSNVITKQKSAYWELPDGSRAVEITGIPSVYCQNCGMHYLEESIIEKIEEQLILVNTKELSNSFLFEELLKKERLLKRNYFKGL